MTTVAIIDGDVVAYSSCKSRYVTNEDGNYYFDGNKTEFNEEEDGKYIEDCWANFKKMLADLEEICFADYSLVALKSDINFRDMIYCDYKANRRNKSKTLTHTFVSIIRRKAIMEGLAIEAVGREADDMLRIWSEEARKAGHDFIILSIDKDLKCIPGKHYNTNHNKFEDVDEDYATRFFYEQLLKGDPTDNIPGILSVGPKKAQKLLADENTEEGYRRVVMSCYHAVYGDEWKNNLLTNGKLLYLQKHPNDYFSIREW